MDPKRNTLKKHIKTNFFIGKKDINEWVDSQQCGESALRKPFIVLPGLFTGRDCGNEADVVRLARPWEKISMFNGMNMKY